jgi:hypothetical protein
MTFGADLYMDSIYGDVNRTQRATQQLRRLQQRRIPFPQFLPIFERTLAEADGANWPSSARIAFLEGALSDDTRDRLVTIKTPDDYAEYVQIIMQISGKLSSTKAQTWQPSQQSQQQATDAMDWEPTVATSSTEVRKSLGPAKWVQRDIIDKRRKENRCIRCGRPGCRTFRCPYGPPIRPTGFQDPRNTTAATTQIEELPSDAESGNGKLL